MIPREAGRGTSFKGAGAYYLHDKNALTTERVEFTHTENIPTQDPEKALKWMAWTAIHAEDLKRQSGSKMSGRPSTKPVYTFSLSWHPEQNPNKWEMVGAGRWALIALGLQRHETVMVAHNDCDHSHLHLIVNVVDPETGKASRVAFSKKKLSKWAEEYEREHGKVYCQKRVENNEKRAEGQKVKYQEPALELKAQITKLYHEADDGEAFQAALTKHGFTLASGKKLVLIDRDGKIHSLARQIEGAKEKFLREKLSGLELPDIDTARKRPPAANEKPEPNPRQNEEPNTQAPGNEQSAAAEPEYSDRDQQDQDWQESIIDAGIANGEDRPRRAKHSDPSRSISPSVLNALQDRHLAELGQFYSQKHDAKLRLSGKLEGQYGAHERELRREAQHLGSILGQSSRLRIWWLKVTRQIPKTAEADLQEMNRTLENIEWRKSEAEQALETNIARQRREIQSRHDQERLEVRPTGAQPTPGQHQPHAGDADQDFDHDDGPALNY